MKAMYFSYIIRHNVDIMLFLFTLFMIFNL